MNRYTLSLLAVALSWGVSFPLIKDITAYLSGLEITAVRFTLCALASLPFARKIPWRAWKDGFYLSVAATICYASQAWGLAYISSARSAVITNLSIVFIPLLSLLAGRYPKPILWAGSLVALVGISIMSWDAHGNWLGDLLTLCTAIAYALWVEMLSRMTHRNKAMDLTVAQIICIALCSCVVTAFFPTGLPGLWTKLHTLNCYAWLSLAYLGLIASGMMLVVQVWAQRHVSSVQAGVIYGTEPVFACIFGWLLLGETLQFSEIMGVSLVVMALIITII